MVYDLVLDAYGFLVCGMYGVWFALWALEGRLCRFIFSWLHFFQWYILVIFFVLQM